MNADFLDRRNTRTRQYGQDARPLDSNRWITLAIDRAYAETPAGQVALITAANLIGRMTPTVALDVPDQVLICQPLPWSQLNLKDVVFEQLFAATPKEKGGQFTARKPATGDYVIALGPTTVPSDVVVHGDGWNAYFGSSASPLVITRAPNPCGPAFAAILCGSHLMASGLRRPERDYFCNTLNWSESFADSSAPQPDPEIDLGDIWTVGTGSVGTAVLYFLTLFTRHFDAALIDKDTVEVENLDRSPIFAATDDGRPKVDATSDYLRSVGVQNVHKEPVILGQSKLWRTRQEGTPDILVSAANEDRVRYQIEVGMPPMQIYGTTGKNWQASLLRHIPLHDACSLCVFPDTDPQAPMSCATGTVIRPDDGKQIDAALPFLSFGAGLMAAAEILKLNIPGYPFSPSSVHFWARAEDKLISMPLRLQANCLCGVGRDRGLHRQMIGRSKYAVLSDF